MNTLFVLQAVCPAVIGVWRNAPVLQLPPEVRMRPCDRVAKRPLPCTSYRSCSKFPPLNFVPRACRRRMRACADEFLATVTEGVVHGVCKDVTQVVFQCNTATQGE